MAHWRPSMRWTRLVVRPDALIRFWCIGGFQPGPSYAEATGDRSFDDLALTRHLFTSDGATHVIAEELDDLYNRLWSAAEADPSVPQRLARHFVAVGEAWVAETKAAVLPAVLSAATNVQLSAMLGDFCSAHSAYAPALYLPFPVERRYAEVFPSLLSRIGAELTARSSTILNEMGDGLGPLVLADPATVEHAIRPILEQSSLRTNAEGKDMALAALARRLSAEFGEHLPADAAGLADRAPRLHTELLEVVEEFGWIAQWGYPPRYSASTPDAMYRESVVRLEAHRRGPIVDGPRTQPFDRNALLALVDATDADRHLVGDFAYYNFYRTYRMELLIQAQFHSAKLLAEIGRRTGLDVDRRSRLAPPELQAALESPASQRAAADIADARAAGWVLETDGRRGIRSVRHGADLAAARAEFLSVIRAREQARGDVDGTDPTQVGGKAAGLAKLVTGGFDVPDYAVVTTRGIDWLKDPSLRTSVASAVWEAVLDLDGDGGLAIRSSASVEDGQRRSWAGRFDTVLGVEPDIDTILAAMETVARSAESERVVDYARRMDPDFDPSGIAMAVVVQRMIEADFAGVINTTMTTADGPCTEIEVVRGLGDKLVDGRCSPAGYLVHRSGTVERSGEDIGFPDRLVGDLTVVAAEIEAHFGSPQDVEFAIRDERILILQSRALTCAPEGQSSDSVGADDGKVVLLTGLSGHVAQRVAGTAILPQAPDAGAQIPAGSIVVLHAATPVWDTVVFQASALVTNEGGSTSHAIRVSNELGIPAVVGTRSATRLVHPGDELVVDTMLPGNTGRVLRGASPHGQPTRRDRT